MQSSTNNRLICMRNKRSNNTFQIQDKNKFHLLIWYTHICSVCVTAQKRSQYRQKYKTATFEGEKDTTFRWATHIKSIRIYKWHWWFFGQLSLLFHVLSLMQWDLITFFPWNISWRSALTSYCLDKCPSVLIKLINYSKNTNLHSHCFPRRNLWTTEGV